MSERFYIKQGDTAPNLRVTLKDPDDTAVNLVGATVTFSMRDGSTAILTKEACTLVDAANGVVEYVWQSGDTDNAGTHAAEFEVVYADSKIETFPNSGFFRVQISKQVV